MALGMTEWSGAVAPADIGAGESQWATVSGMNPGHPLVGGPHVSGLGAFDVDRSRSHIQTIPGAEGGGAAPWTGAMAGAPGVELLDDWRDLFNFRGSPMPWLLLLALGALGVAQLSVSGRVGPVRAGGSVG
ncbi:MAG TPA: hypothetical protein VMY78_09935 [Solirubrobacteraceae bacterium]|nr:hypothetical protein [Solirubrobacteraceae bacterium]